MLLELITIIARLDFSTIDHIIIVKFETFFLVMYMSGLLITTMLYPCFTLLWSYAIECCLNDM